MYLFPHWYYHVEWILLLFLKNCDSPNHPSLFISSKAKVTFFWRRVVLKIQSDSFILFQIAALGTWCGVSKLSAFFRVWRTCNMRAPNDCSISYADALILCKTIDHDLILEECHIIPDIYFVFAIKAFFCCFHKIFILEHSATESKTFLWIIISMNEDEMSWSMTSQWSCSVIFLMFISIILFVERIYLIVDLSLFVISSFVI